MVEEAVDCFWKGELILKALECSFEIHHYKQAIVELEKPKNLRNISQVEVNKLILKCSKKGALYAIDNRPQSSASNIYEAFLLEINYFVNFFPTVNEKRTFLKRHDLYSNLLSLDICTGAFGDAAQTCELLLTFEEASKYYGMANLNVKSIMCQLIHVRNEILNAYNGDGTFLPVATSTEAFDKLHRIQDSIDAGPQCNQLDVVAYEVDLLTVGSGLFQSTGTEQITEKLDRRTFDKTLLDKFSLVQSAQIGQNIRLKFILEQFNFKLLYEIAMAHDTSSNFQTFNAIMLKLVDCCEQLQLIVHKIELCYMQCLKGEVLQASTKRIICYCFEYFAAFPRSDGNFHLTSKLRLPKIAMVRELFGPCDLSFKIVEVSLDTFF
jgi:hypothetical protein